MTTPTKYKRESQEESVGTQLKWGGISEPGAYLSNWSGHLIRLPEDALEPGRSPVFEIIGKEPLMVTKLCNDPFVPVSKARMIAADLDLAVNF